MEYLCLRQTYIPRSTESSLAMCKYLKLAGLHFRPNRGPDFTHKLHDCDSVHRCINNSNTFSTLPRTHRPIYKYSRSLTCRCCSCDQTQRNHPGRDPVREVVRMCQHQIWYSLTVISMLMKLMYDIHPGWFSLGHSPLPATS